MGEFAWGLYEPEEGKYDFDWMRRAMDVMANAGIQVMLGTPTAAPPIWLAKKHPEILPLDERGLLKHEGTRKAYCMNSSVYWSIARKSLPNSPKPSANTAAHRLANRERPWRP